MHAHTTNSTGEARNSSDWDGLLCDFATRSVLRNRQGRNASYHIAVVGPVKPVDDSDGRGRTLDYVN